MISVFLYSVIKKNKRKNILKKTKKEKEKRKKKQKKKNFCYLFLLLQLNILPPFFSVPTL